MARSKTKGKVLTVQIEFCYRDLPFLGICHRDFDSGHVSARFCSLSIEKDCKNNKKRKEEVVDDDGSALFQVGVEKFFESMLENERV